MRRSSDDNNLKAYETKEPILFYPDDPPEFYALISDLIERKYYVRRASKHQVKHRAVNYYPSTGTITIDGKGRHPGKGPEALLVLLEQMYPRRRRGGADAPSAPPPPSPLVLEIDLDSDNVLEETGRNREQNEDGGLPW